jgi:hypothetical protein
MVENTVGNNRSGRKNSQKQEWSLERQQAPCKPAETRASNRDKKAEKAAAMGEKR